MLLHCSLNRSSTPPSCSFADLLAPSPPAWHPAVGKVAGSFYRIVIDGQPARLAAMLLHAATLYAASTALYAAACWVTGGR